MKKGFSVSLTRLWLVLIVLAIPYAPMPAQVDQGAFNDAPPPAATLPPAAMVLRERWVTINFERVRESLPQALGGNGSRTLLVNLFPDARFTAVLDRVETTATGYVWTGRLQGLEPSSVTIAVTGNVMSASITNAETAYVIRHVAAGIHVIEEINRQAFPPEAPPLIVPDPAGPPGDVQAYVDDGSQIEVLVVYTPAARIAQGGTAAIESLIDLGVSETNQAYADSGAIQRIRLVNKQEISYTESASISVDLTRLRSTSDGHMDVVHSIRDAYAADIVQLIENNPSACGIAYLMTNVSNSFAANAFGITHYSCISPNYSFGHEMGHNMGLGHDTYVYSGPTPYAYSHGYVNQAAFVPGAPASTRWRDIMAYNDQCQDAGFNCSRVRYFSNPSNLYNGDVMGDVGTANAVLSLNNTRVTVANFRASVVKKRGGQLTSQ